MGVTDIEIAVIYQATGVQLMARITGSDGTVITQADVASIERTMYNLGSLTPDAVIDTAAPVVADTVYDTLQTDDRWSGSATGYNVRDQVAAAKITDNVRYRVQYVFTPTGDGEVYRWDAEIHAQP